MAYREGTVLKHEIAFFAQIESEGAYTRISKGVTDMSGSLNPTIETTQYIGESTKTQTATAYEPTLTFTAERYGLDDFNDRMYEIGRDQLLNQEIPMIVRVDLGDPGDSENVFKATAAKYKVSIDSNDTGAAGAKVGFTGTLSQVGEIIKGTFNISTNEFTAE